VWWYLIVVAVLSLVSFAAYGFDKYKARRESRRIPENTLHLIDLLGGWPGGLVGRNVWRHKTQKWPFVFVFWLTVIVHLASVAAYLYWQRQ
jgi:uncharacterized membrane protein YsdA (DUF1294 family)